MKFGRLAALPVAAMLLSGCTFGTGVENLLSPPRLSGEQTMIKQALTDSVGKNIKLKYPKNGDYRSAFVIANIDEEETDEAIVFYERTSLTSTESKVRMAVLDQKDGKWVAAFDQAGEGNDIERIRIDVFGNEYTPTITVGYSVVGATEKNLVGYTYTSGVLSQFFATTCVSTAVIDLDNCGDNELIVFSSGVSGEAAARVYRKTEGTFELSGETGIITGANGDYASITRGKLSNGSNAIYVDTANGDGTIGTQILYEVDGVLKNPIYTLQYGSNAESFTKTFRPSKYTSRDIDNDGVTEIPLISVFPGYETADKSEQLFLTDWYVFDTTKLALSKKNSGYLSITDGYCFMLPSRWTGTVTIKEDAANDEVVFYKYEGDINADMTELMRICSVKKSDAAAKRDNGYIAVAERGQLEYLVKVQNNNSEPLILTISEIMYNFTLI